MRSDRVIVNQNALFAYCYADKAFFLPVSVPVSAEQTGKLGEPLRHVDHAGELERDQRDNAGGEQAADDFSHKVGFFGLLDRCFGRGCFGFG